MDALRRLDVDPGAGIAGAAEHQRIFAARIFQQLLAQILADANEDDERQDRRKEEAHDRRGRLLHLFGERRAAVVQALGQRGIVHCTGRVDRRFVLVGKDDLVAVHLHLADVLFLDHAHERAVVHLRDLLLHEKRRHDEIEQKDHQQDDPVIIEKRFFRGFHFFHRTHSLCFFYIIKNSASNV